MPHFSELAIQLVADAKIQQAYDDGKFDNLPGFGKPIEFEPDGTLMPWVKSKIKRENIKLSLRKNSD